MKISPMHNGSILVNKNNKTYMKRKYILEEIKVHNDDGACTVLSTNRNYDSLIEAYFSINNKHEYDEPRLVAGSI